MGAAAREAHMTLLTAREAAERLTASQLASQWLGHAAVVTTERHYAGIALSSSASAMDRVDAAAALPRIGRVHESS